MAINISDLPLFRDSSQPRTPDGELEASQYEMARKTRLNAVRRETQDITLTTREGDTVNIDASALLQASYVGFDYSQQVKNGLQSVQMEQLGISSQSGFAMTVQGDLNEEEKKDIQEVIAKLDDVMKKLVNGDVEGLTALIPGLLDDAETLSGLEAVLKYEQRVTAEHQTMMQWQGAGPTLPPPPGEDMPPDSLQQPERPKDPFSAGRELIAKIAGKMLELFDSAQTDKEKLAEPVKNYFNELVKSLESPDGEKNPISNLTQMLGNEMTRLLAETPQPTETKLPAPEKTEGIEVPS